jgi:glycosyltransferase involved in cell wall biosynthesis
MEALPGEADIVIGIPSYNNARTIGHVVRAAHAGLMKYFPQYTGVIINSDGGSTDGTPGVVLSSQPPDARLLMLNTPIKAVHRLSLPYHGIPGKGSAFRMIFQMASSMSAKACAVVDSDLRSITPEWIDLLIRPVLHAGFDFVAPYYHRHKYDGTITNSIVYPLTRALYGKRLRQPIGGDFGLSGPLMARYLERQDWETDVARFGIDIWMTTIALAEGYRVCQSFLGAKLHDAKDPGADLSAMLQQVAGSVFSLMHEYEGIWPAIRGSEEADLFGFRHDVGLDPIDVNLDRMLRTFRASAHDLPEVWALALRSSTLDAVQGLARHSGADGAFRFEDELWVSVIHEFALAHREKRLERGHLLKSLTPLYIGRVASFVNEVRELGADAVEERIETLCECFEARKQDLTASWLLGGARTGEALSGKAAGREERKVLA